MKRNCGANVYIAWTDKYFTQSQSQSHITTDSLSAIPSWYQTSPKILAAKELVVASHHHTLSLPPGNFGPKTTRLSSSPTLLFCFPD
jgi:hypothetical protein